jgi:hypothetical protein
MIAVNDRFDGKSIKLIAFAMICVSKMKAEPDGNFRCNLSSIAIWCGMSIRYLMNIIREVEDYDFVRAISKDKTSVNLKDRDGGKYKRISEPNIYKLIHDSGNEVIYTITDDSDINREFAKIYKLCIDKYGFKCNTKVKSFLLEELE